MAIYSRPEFCKLVGIKQAALSTQISRGKIIVFEEGGKDKIDDSIRENADFIKKQQTTNALKEAKEVVNSDNPVQIPHSEKSKKLKNKEEKTQMSLFDLNLEKARADIDKKYIDTRLAEMKMEVLMGANIPINHVKSIVSTLSKSILTNYKAFQDQIISEFCHQYKISDAERSKILAKAVAGLNAIHLKAVSESKIQMKNAMGTTQNELAIEDDEQ